MARTPDDRRPMVITRQIDYFEIGVFGICALYGVITLARYQDLAATSVKMYPGMGGVIFLGGLVAGGATGLVSYAFKTIIGPKLEVAGLTLLVVLCLTYSLWTPFSVGLRGIGLLLFMGILIAIPGFFTRRRILRYIQRVELIEKDHSLLGVEENESHAEGNNGMDHRRFWRRWGK